ncbi:hypothetical protein LOTGIDRAFT_163341 [Lottia gigantea]|uniref:RING-type domain-containing protein n=1 Tax=Lottia gigantea TaxID=225164 RepID=V4AE48_LOTGI|nr:hypothetical protein LOTGIDRAFT_163341 [Lottia gigantea]ESO91616.1 hypothetical protein LOTGIDRAFT_163341 [Lottia gigantea]
MAVKLGPGWCDMARPPPLRWLRALGLKNHWSNGGRWFGLVWLDYLLSVGKLEDLNEESFVCLSLYGEKISRDHRMAPVLHATSRPFVMSGIDVSNFEEPLRERAVCPICQQILQKPMQLSCGHHVCLKCLKVVFQNNDSAICPVNDDDDCKNINRSKVFLDVSVGKQVDKLVVTNPNIKSEFSADSRWNKTQRSSNDINSRILKNEQDLKDLKSVIISQYEQIESLDRKVSELTHKNNSLEQDGLLKEEERVKNLTQIQNNDIGAVVSKDSRAVVSKDSRAVVSNDIGTVVSKFGTINRMAGPNYPIDANESRHYVKYRLKRVARIVVRANVHVQGNQ